MRMTVNNRFAILLAEKRVKERRNISLAEIAAATGISRKTLYAWENNRVNRFDVPVIDALCEYFSIQPGDLFHYVKPEKGKSGKVTFSNMPYKEGENHHIEYLLNPDANAEDVIATITKIPQEKLPPMRTPKIIKAKPKSRTKKKKK